ncbi:MAG: M56 family metallopeptidase [Gemmatimonadaceae bacterium]
MRVSHIIVAPATIGCWRPVVLMPASFGEWTAEQTRAVLAHELAHVKRHDCLTSMLAQVVCAVQWYNPLVWLAERRMRAERERACDDRALASGVDATQYALLLLTSHVRRSAASHCRRAS